ncbi:MAG TPA: hypothetical protein VEJ68_03430, partial [Candidatus Bathyarchaeia archaeon]|nr:hypothetical protein [Candidatus Bathyarchaeia archaeon]
NPITDEGRGAYPFRTKNPLSGIFNFSSLELCKVNIIMTNTAIIIKIKRRQFPLLTHQKPIDDQSADSSNESSSRYPSSKYILA